MALERCIFENNTIYQENLEICLDRLYPQQTYKFKKPSISGNHLFFNLKGVKVASKLVLLSNIEDKELSQIVTLTKQGVHDLELNLKNGVYRLYMSGDLIGEFRDKKVLKKYLSNYRLIHKRGKNGGDIDIKLYYKNDKLQKNMDYFKLNSNIVIDITSSKEDYYLAIFSLNRDGNSL